MKKCISFLLSLSLLLALGLGVQAATAIGLQGTTQTPVVLSSKTETAEGQDKEGTDTQAAEEEASAGTDTEEETALERISSMDPAEWVVALVLLGLCGLGYYMTQRRQ